MGRDVYLFIAVYTSLVFPFHFKPFLTKSDWAKVIWKVNPRSDLVVNVRNAELVFLNELELSSRGLM